MVAVEVGAPVLWLLFSMAPPAPRLPPPPSASLLANVLPFSASEGRHYGRNESEETWREFLYSFQTFKRPALRQTAQVRVSGG
jgi:hypothetical protein